MSIRQAKIRGEVIVAKPVLLLALIDGIEAGVFRDNRFTLNEWLEKHYLSLMRQYTRHSQFDKPTEINNGKNGANPAMSLSLQKSNEKR